MPCTGTGELGRQDAPTPVWEGQSYRTPQSSLGVVTGHGEPLQTLE